MSYKTDHICNISEYLIQEEIIEYKYYYVCCTGIGGSTLVLFEPNHNVLFEIKTIAKWFQKYIDKSVKVDTRATFEDFPDSVMKQVIHENFDYVNNLYSKGRVSMINNFEQMSKMEIYKKIKDWEMDNTFLSFKGVEKFLILLNTLSRKEKITKLLE
jgi:hypothetical protein